MYSVKTILYLRKIIKLINFLGLCPILMHPKKDRLIEDRKGKTKHVLCCVSKIHIQFWITLLLYYAYTTRNYIDPMIRFFIYAGFLFHISILALDFVSLTRLDCIIVGSNLALNAFENLQVEILNNGIRKPKPLSDKGSKLIENMIACQLVVLTLILTFQFLYWDEVFEFLQKLALSITGYSQFLSNILFHVSVGIILFVNTITVINILAVHTLVDAAIITSIIYGPKMFSALRIPGTNRDPMLRQNGVPSVMDSMKFYRSIQHLNIIILEGGSQVINFVFGAELVAQVIAGYFLVAGGSSVLIRIMAAVTFGFVTTISWMFLTGASELRKSSSQIIQAWLQATKFTEHYDFVKKFTKSCTLFEIKFAGSIRIDSTTGLKQNEIVLGSVIDLLIAYS